ncbi:MAG: hypothetical protein LBG80_18455 [Bacteroidales bacterium]|nr:hypothetical protein [Bacteroidales bacterium]
MTLNPVYLNYPVPKSVKTKVSSQFRNPEGKGAERFAWLRSIIDTTIKDGQDVFFALNCLANIPIKNSS